MERELEPLKAQTRREHTTQQSAPEPSTGNSVSLTGHRPRQSAVMALEDRPSAMAAALNLPRPGHADAEIVRSRTPEPAVQSAAAPIIPHAVEEDLDLFVPAAAVVAPVPHPVVAAIPPVALDGVHNLAPVLGGAAPLVNPVAQPVAANPIIPAPPQPNNIVIPAWPESLVHGAFGPFLDDADRLVLGGVSAQHAITNLRSRITNENDHVDRADQMAAFTIIAKSLCDPRESAATKARLNDMINEILDLDHPAFEGKEELADKFMLERLNRQSAAELMRNDEDHFGLVDFFFKGSTDAEREDLADKFEAIVNPRAKAAVVREFKAVRDELAVSEPRHFSADTRRAVIEFFGHEMSANVRKYFDD